jgi:hypothetical protein
MTSFLKFSAVLLFVTVTAFAQTPTPPTPTPITAPIKNLYAVGGSFNVNAKPSVAGSALYAHFVASPGTYAFTVIDVLPNTVKPFTVTNNIGAGLAQKMLTIRNVSLYMPTTAGVSWSGTNTGWQWTGGGAIVIPMKNNLYMVPTLRFLKSSVSGGTGYQPIFGLSLGWGQ